MPRSRSFYPKSQTNRATVSNHCPPPASLSGWSVLGGENALSMANAHAQMNRLENSLGVYEILRRCIILVTRERVIANLSGLKHKQVLETM